MKGEKYTIEKTPLNAPSLSDSKAKKIILPETPCDKCWFGNKDECQKKEIACSDLSYYLSKGIVRDEERIPDRDTYLKITGKEEGVIISDGNETQIIDAGTTLHKELKLLNKLRVRSLEEIEKYFDNKTTLEKAKVACIVYGLILKSDTIELQSK